MILKQHRTLTPFGVSKDGMNVLLSQDRFFMHVIYSTRRVYRYKQGMNYVLAPFFLVNHQDYDRNFVYRCYESFLKVCNNVMTSYNNAAILLRSSWQQRLAMETLDHCNAYGWSDKLEWCD